jgi:hypothetical protein
MIELLKRTAGILGLLPRGEGVSHHERLQWELTLAHKAALAEDERKRERVRLDLRAWEAKGGRAAWETWAAWARANTKGGLEAWENWSEWKRLAHREEPARLSDYLNSPMEAAA